MGITAARVPMIFATPDGKPGTTTSLAELVELFPSLTDLCGLKTLVKLDGVIQVPVLKDVSKSVKRSAFTQHPRPADFDRTESKMPEAMGSSDRIATHRSTEWRAGKDGKLVGGERYALDTDPAELDNVVKSPESAAPPKAALQALHRQFPPDTPPSKR